MIKMNKEEILKLQVCSSEYFKLLVVVRQAAAIIPHIKQHAVNDGGKLWNHFKKLEDAIKELNCLK